MKLSVSNIIWDSSDTKRFIEACANNDCQGVELAPDKVWQEPLKSSYKERYQLRKEIEQHGLSLTGFHALLFTRPDLNLFQSNSSRQETFVYLSNLASLCAELGGRNLILGSPNNRMLCGLDYDYCFKTATDFFGKLAHVCQENGVKFCIEPLPKEQTNFISSAIEGERLVQAVNHPYFCLHLDASALRKESEKPEIIINKIITPEHFHVNDPNLNIPGSSTQDLELMIQSLWRKNYQGFVSIEVTTKHQIPKLALESSVSYLKQIFSNLNII